jgi:hypothetical protein
MKPLSLSSYNNQLKWIKYLNVTPETTKLLQNSIGNYFRILEWERIYLEKNPKSQETKANLAKWDKLKFKILHSKRNNTVKIQPIEREKICANM